MHANESEESSHFRGTFLPSMSVDVLLTAQNLYLLLAW